MHIIHGPLPKFDSDELGILYKSTPPAPPGALGFMKSRPYRHIDEYDDTLHSKVRFFADK
jgi:hypothetical protein